MSNIRYINNDFSLDSSEVDILLEQVLDEFSFVLSNGTAVNDAKAGQILFNVRDILVKELGKTEEESGGIVLDYILSQIKMIKDDYGGDKQAYLKDNYGMSAREYLEARMSGQHVSASDSKPQANHFIDNVREFVLSRDLQKAHDAEIELLNAEIERSNARLIKERAKLEKDRAERAKKQAEMQKKGKGKTVVQKYLEARALARQRSEQVMKRFSNALNKLKSAKANRALNYWNTEEGKAVYKRLIKDGAKLSLATRKAMGVRTGKEPSQVDLRLAEKQILELVQSKSRSKANQLAYLLRIRSIAADVVRKQYPKRKTPGLQRVRNAAAELKLKISTIENKGKLRSKGPVLNDVLDAEKDPSKRQAIRMMFVRLAKRRADRAKEKAEEKSKDADNTAKPARPKRNDDSGFEP